MRVFDSKMAVIDLFCGCGGLSLGAARSGFTVRGAVDTDSESISAHNLNFPRTIHLQTDISDLHGQSLRNSLNLNSGDLAAIIGGPPCQGFSSIGKNNKDDPRNKLFPEFFRIVSETRPKFYFAENVPGILHEKNSETLKEAFNYVEGKYTIIPPMTFKASDYGAPTARTRIFFFGYLKDEMESLTTDDFEPTSDVEIIHVKHALLGLPTKIKSTWQTEEKGWRVVHVYGNGYYNSRLHYHIPRGVGNQNALERLKKESRASGSLGTLHSKRVRERYASIECGKIDAVSRAYRLDPNNYCPTLRAGTGRDHGSFQAVRPLHPTEDRVITPREAARLQGFPDWFQFSPTKWHSFRQIGSSVSPILAERIFTVIRQALASSDIDN